MTQRELNGAAKVHMFGMARAQEANRHWKEREEAKAAGDMVKAEVAQRLADTARGEALGAMQAICLIGGELRKYGYVEAIAKELGE